MANEIRIQVSLQVTNGNLQYRSAPTSFNATQSSAIGTTPGYGSASQSGSVVSLSQLTTPGVAMIYNLDAANALEVGLYDPDTNEFYPMLEVLAGEFYCVRLSQFLGQEMGTSASGTAPTGSGVQLMVRGVGGAVPYRLDAFNK